jgi:hypothetical protein
VMFTGLLVYRDDLGVGVVTGLQVLSLIVPCILVLF